MSNSETALSAFADAQADGSAVDWQALAAMLAAAIPAPKRRKADPNAAPAWWTAYTLPQAFHTESCDVTFADGVSVRVGVCRKPGKPWRVETATRGAVGFYRARMRTDGAVPAIVAIDAPDTGEAWDAGTVSALSASFRAPLPPALAPRPAVTVETLERLTAEYERRKAGLARAQAVERTCGHRYPEGHTTSPHWLDALKGIRKEIAACRAVLEAAPVRTAPLFLAPPIAPVGLDADACAVTLAEAYADPAEWEISGTVDADPAPGLGLVHLIPAVSVVAVDDTPIPGADLVHTADATGSEPAPVLSTEPAIIEAEPGPTPASHPVVALCLSGAARAALLERVMDGTAPAQGRTARGGAWRLSLADAQDLQDIPSIRWVGMPRKAYTRRAAPVSPPVVEIAAVSVSSVSNVMPETDMPHPAFHPGGGRVPSPVTFHAAP